MVCFACWECKFITKDFYLGNQNWRWWENEITCWQRLSLTNLSICPVGTLLSQSMRLSGFGHANDTKPRMRSRAIPDGNMEPSTNLMLSYCSLLTTDLNLKFGDLETQATRSPADLILAYIIFQELCAQFMISCILLWMGITTCSLQDYFTGIGIMIWLPQCQQGKLQEYGCVDHIHHLRTKRVYLSRQFKLFITQMQLEYRLSVLLQLHFHSQLNA